MMLMQTPGGFIFAYTLAVRPGVNFTTWLPYIIAGTLQGILLIMSLIFTYCYHAENTIEYVVIVNDADGEVNEEPAVISDGLNLICDDDVEIPN